MNRRTLLGFGGALGAAAVIASWRPRASAASEVFPVSLSDAEWHKRLTPEQFNILRQAGTEYPFTSPLLHEARQGIFTCAGCDQDLFSSTTKFDSHTGWPSFWAPLDKAVATETDTSFNMVRNAVHCTKCGGHLGHVFADGPAPTGLRYCMNGVAMAFRATTA